LKIEKKFSLSKPATTTKKINFILFYFIFFRVRADALPRPRTVKTRPRGKRGRALTSERKGRPDGNFLPKSSFMTSLRQDGIFCTKLLCDTFWFIMLIVNVCKCYW
jgi:hypothetical protein